MKIINSSNRTLKLFSLVLIALLILSAVSISITAIVTVHNNGIDLDTVSYREVENVATIVNANSKVNNSNGISAAAGIDAPSGTAEERYLTLYDFDNTKKYLYIEYIGEGFAIYDRLGEYIYEKSELGNGPFDEFSENDKIYYGGPSYYYVAENGGYRHVVTGAVIGAADAKGFSDGLQEIRAKYQDNQLSELSLRSAVSYATNDLFLAGRNFKDEHLKEIAGNYFLQKALMSNYHSDFSYGDIVTQIWDMSNDTLGYKYPFIDLYCGKNKYGSCGYVALSAIMLYYDRCGLASMIINKENWHLMYDYSIFITHAEVGKDLSHLGGLYTGKISKISNKYLTSEFLHQELLYLQYPQYRDVSTDVLETMTTPYPFASTNSERKGAYERYCVTNGVNKFGYVYDSGTYKLPEKIVNGNVCIATLKTGAPYTDNHAVVAYAFYGTKPWWYTVSSVLCDYGWSRSKADMPIYAAVEVNANFIYSNECIDVFRY